MDREEFNPDLCMLRYAEECSLPNLLARKSHIDSQINNFSSDLQNLLYDNYRKFVNVTSVVSKMKTKFEKMEEEAHSLCDQMKGIEQTSSLIVQNLRPSEDKIYKLLKRRDTMKKMVVLMDIVPTLQMYLKSGMYSAAARHYLKVKNVIKKYENLSSFKGKVYDCTEVVANIRVALRKTLNCEVYGKEELADTLGLLLELGEDPERLIEYFLCNAASAYLKSQQISMDETWVKDMEAKNMITHIVTKYVNSCCDYMKRMSDVIEIVKKLFWTKNEKIFENRTRSFFLTNMDDLSANLLHHLNETFSIIGDEFLSQILDKFLRQSHAYGILATHINFFTKGTDIVLQICAARCEYHLQNMKSNFQIQLQNLAGEVSSDVNVLKTILYLAEWTEQTMILLLQTVACYIRHELRCCREVTFRKVFCKVVVREGIFVAFFRYIIQECRICHVSESKKKVPKMCLYVVLSKFLLHVHEHDVVPRFLSSVDDYLYSSTETLVLTSAQAISTEFEKEAQATIELYVQIRSQTITHMIRKSTENRNWMTSKNPTRPRAVIKMIVNDIRETIKETEKVFGKYGSALKRKDSVIGSPFLFKTYPNEGGLNRNLLEEKVLVNKMLAESSNFPGKVEPNVQSIVFCLLKNVLNSFIQFIRLQTLNHISLQQIQLDVCFLQNRFSEMLQIGPNIQTLLDEIISSAYNRSFTP